MGGGSGEVAQAVNEGPNVCKDNWNVFPILRAPPFVSFGAPNALVIAAKVNIQVAVG